MPNACSREVNSVLGNKWSKFTKQEKKKFVREAKDNKRTIKAKRKAVEEQMGCKLQKPCCAYSLFMKDVMHQIQAENPNVTHNRIM